MNPNTLLLVIAVVTVIATAFAYIRSTAVKVWEQNAEAYKAQVDLLEKANAALNTKIDWLEQRIHELEARPNYEQVVAIMALTEKRIIDAIEKMREVDRESRTPA